MTIETNDVQKAFMKLLVELGADTVMVVGSIDCLDILFGKDNVNEHAYVFSEVIAHTPVALSINYQDIPVNSVYVYMCISDGILLSASDIYVMPLPNNNGNLLRYKCTTEILG